MYRWVFDAMHQVEGDGVDVVAGRSDGGSEDTRDVAPSTLAPGERFRRDRKLVRSCSALVSRARDLLP